MTRPAYTKKIIDGLEGVIEMAERQGASLSPANHPVRAAIRYLDGLVRWARKTHPQWRGR